MGNYEEIKQFSKDNDLKMLPKLDVFAELLHPTKAGLSEAVIPPSSQLIGTEDALKMERQDFGERKLHRDAVPRRSVDLLGQTTDTTQLFPDP